MPETHNLKCLPLDSLVLGGDPNRPQVSCSELVGMPCCCLLKLVVCWPLHCSLHVVTLGVFLQPCCGPPGFEALVMDCTVTEHPSLVACMQYKLCPVWCGAAHQGCCATQFVCYCGLWELLAQGSATPWCVCVPHLDTQSLRQCRAKDMNASCATGVCVCECTPLSGVEEEGGLCPDLLCVCRMSLVCLWTRWSPDPVE